MNFNFADINSLMDNIIQHGQSPGIKKALPEGVSSDSLNEFENGIAGALEGSRDNGSFHSCLNQAMEGSTVSQGGQKTVIQETLKKEAILDSINEASLKTLASLEGFNFLMELKEALLSAGQGDLSEITIDAQGLQNLESILIEAGFDSNEVQDLIADLTLTLEETSTLSFADFMDDLFELSLADDSQDDAQAVLASSAVPFLQTLLVNLGIESAQAEQVIAQAMQGGQGIRLDSLIDELKAIQDAALVSKQSYTALEGEEPFAALLKQLGIDSSQVSGTSSESASLVLASSESASNSVSQGLSLTELISLLEAKQQEITGQTPDPQTGSAQQAGRLEALFQHLETDGKSATAAGTLEMSWEQPPDTRELPQAGIKENMGTLSQVIETTSDSGLGQGSTKDGFKGFESSTGEKSNTVNLVQMGTASDSNTSEASFGREVLKSASQSFKSLPNHVINQVGKGIVRAANLGEKTLTLKLNPPELGRVNMTIEHNGNSMKVNIVTDNHAAREILTSNVNELKTVLASSGISLDQFEVDMNSNFRQSMADAQDGQFQNNQNKKQGASFGNGEADDTATEDIALSGMETPGSYHFVA